MTGWVQYLNFKYHEKQVQNREELNAKKIQEEWLKNKINSLSKVA